MPSENNVECYIAPKWLTKDYVQDVLRKYFKDKTISIVDLEIKPGTAKGENYASVMTRINVVYRNTIGLNHKVTYLMKTTYNEGDPSANFFGQFGMYKREMDMYEIVLPKLAALLSELGDKERLHANTVCVDRLHTSIIFEDLSLDNYKNADRIERMDMFHAKLALRKLAKLHGSAAVLNERSPGIFNDNFNIGLFTRKIEGFKPVITGILSALIRYIDKLPELKAKYHKKLVVLCDNFMEYGARVFDVNKTQFNTLVHCDYWTTNIMFQYPEGNIQKTPLSVIPIDFQYCTWGSPAIDLHYFFNTSLREELRLHQQPELVQYYHEQLVEILRSLKYRGHIPTLFEFHLQFEERSFYGVFAALIFQPFMIYDGNLVPSWEDILLSSDTGNAFKNSLFDNATVQKNVERLLPIFDQKGLLDVMD